MNAPLHESALAPAAQRFNVEKVRADFPILTQQVHGKPLVYLDNAGTSHKPRSVIEAETKFYETYNSNIHRGVHLLSQRATDAFEAAREKTRRFVNARSLEEIVFTRGATEAINLVAQSYARNKLQAGDEIIVSHMEHHSNIVPWQFVCEQVGAVLKVIPVNDDGELLLDEYEKLLGPRTKVVAVNHISNSIGTINPVKHIARLAHQVGAVVLVDGAQAGPHMKIDVQDLDCDFYALSCHKIYAPTGLGVLYGKRALLEAMPPYHGGGHMIKKVTFAKTTFNDLPFKFEAGTLNIAGVIGFAAAMDYVNALGLDAIAAHEHDLLAYATEQAASIKGLNVVGRARNKAAIFSFTLDGIHPHDIGTVLDMEGVAIRTGHHCTMPLMERFGLPASARASLALYNTRAEIDTLFAALRKCQEMFQR